MHCDNVLLWCRDELNSGQFTDHSTLDVNLAMGMLRYAIILWGPAITRLTAFLVCRYALKHPLVCHQQANARHYEKSTLSRNLYTKSTRAERQARQETIDETKRADITDKKDSMHTSAMDAAADSHAELSRGSPAEHALGRLLNSRRWKLPPSMAALDLKLEKGWKTHARDIISISKSSTISQASNPKAQRHSLRTQQSHQNSFARRPRAERSAQPRRPNRLRSVEEAHAERLQTNECEDVLRIVQNVLAQNSWALAMKYSFTEPVPYHLFVTFYTCSSQCKVVISRTIVQTCCRGNIPERNIWQETTGRYLR